jgi:hypothetical protein
LLGSSKLVAVSTEVLASLGGGSGDDSTYGSRGDPARGDLRAGNHTTDNYFRSMAAYGANVAVG